MGFGVEDGRLLFEVPVYRLSPEAWHREVEQAVQRFAESSCYGDPAKRIDRGYLLAAHERGYGTPAYNQTVAWIRIVWNDPGAVVKAYAYKARQKRIVKSFRVGQYEWSGDIFELLFTPDETSAEIAAQVRDELLKTTAKDGIFRGRYLDLEAFDSTSSHVNWRTLIGINANN